MACFALEEAEAALKAFREGALLEPENSNFKKWIRKCEAELAAEQGIQPSATTVPAPPDTDAGARATTAAGANRLVCRRLCYLASQLAVVLQFR